MKLNFLSPLGNILFYLYITDTAKRKLFLVAAQAEACANPMLAPR